MKRIKQIQSTAPYRIKILFWNNQVKVFETTNRKIALSTLNKCKKLEGFKIAQLIDGNKIIKEIDCFTNQWILEKAVPIINSYTDELTIRALHYRLVGLGMSNTNKHYMRVVTTMIKARWDGVIYFDAFSDHERETIGDTKFEETDAESSASSSIKYIEYWMNNYEKNRWENQPIYPEVFIEKKALQGVFSGICEKWDVALNPCKGYPSLTFLYNAANRFKKAVQNNKKPVILYFGDYDPSGEDIPRSIEENMYKMGVDVRLIRVALMESQVIEWNLPPAPTKDTDSRSVNWDGLGQVELDAVMPEKLKDLCNEALEGLFDFDLYNELLLKEEEEAEEYKKILKDFTNNL